MIIVCGMHRSGTSALAELLGELGLDLGDPDGFHAADRWNERGYFEQREVIDLNSRIVSGFPRTRSRLARWLAHLRYLSMPSPMALQRRAERRLPEMRGLARKYEGRVVKDPRFCLTLPCWQRIDAVEAVVVCVRHPAEVADSLWQRQRVPHRLALRFWDYHIRALLDASRHVPSVFVEYEQLLSGDAATCARLSKFISLDLSAEDLELHRSNVISDGLRRSRGQVLDLPEETARLYRALRERSADR